MLKCVAVIIMTTFVLSRSYANDAVKPCPDKFRQLFVQQQIFENYSTRMAPEQFERWTSSVRRVEDLLDRLHDQFAASKKIELLDKSDVAALTQEIDTHLKLYGFNVRIDPTDNGTLLIDSLPFGHPLTNVFRRTQRPPLGVQYVFKTREYIEGEMDGFHDRNGGIYLSSLIHGKISTALLLHEVGHRASYIQSRTQQLHLYNVRATITDPERAKRIIHIPRDYSEELSGDELRQYEGDLKRLDSKSGETIAASLDKTLGHARETRRYLLKEIALALQSRADYVLNNLKNETFELALNQPSSNLELPSQTTKMVIRNKKNVVVGELVYDLTASKISVSRRTFVPSNDGFVEMKDGAAETNKIYSQHEVDAIDIRDSTDESEKIRDVVRKIAEFEKSEAERVLKYLETRDGKTTPKKP